MKRTIYLSEYLDQKVEEYLKNTPDKSFSNLIQEALEMKLAEKDISQLLELAGIIKEAPREASENAEDYQY
jgi:metal-responsive CopG/Arc/MetJ family transcriptional regulator